MGLSALKGKRVKKKKDITRKSKTGLAHVPLTTFISMSEHIHMEVPRKEITSFVRKFVRKTFGKTYSNFSEWVYNKPTIVMSVLWKNTGNEFPPKWDHERALSSFKEDLDKAFSQYKSQEDPGTPNKSVSSPTDIIKSKTSKLIAEAEGIVDDWENNLNFSMFKELKEIDAPYIMAKSVRDFYF